MTNCQMDSIEDYDDIDTYHQYREAREAGLSDKEALEACYRFSVIMQELPCSGMPVKMPDLRKGCPGFVLMKITEWSTWRTRRRIRDLSFIFIGS